MLFTYRLKLGNKNDGDRRDGKEGKWGEGKKEIWDVGATE
jgi:hypothetical protein